MIKLFCGFDERESIGFHTFVSSVLDRASVPVSIHALHSNGLPQGSNAFTYSRFLVPWLCEFKGRAIFADASDQLMLEDIAELDALFDPRFAVQCVQHASYKTRHQIKYIGTTMQCPNRDYSRKNWSSLMLMNCEHESWSAFDPQSIAKAQGVDLLRLLSHDPIGALPDKWNRLVDEGQSVDGAAVLHWTAGIPAIPNYSKSPGADLWFAQRDRMLEVA